MFQPFSLIEFGIFLSFPETNHFTYTEIIDIGYFCQGNTKLKSAA